MSLPRVAAIVDEYWERSHSDLIVTRLMRGYELLWVPVEPGVQVTSLYIDHAGGLDVGRSRAADAGAAVYPSVREALCAGGDRLSVQGAVIVPERNLKGGREPTLDDRGQAQDCRVQFFDAVAAACREAGRPVPVFIDKHLGTTWEQASHVYEVARELEMPLMAGSSVPVTVRFPPAQLPLGAPVEEVVVVSTGVGEAAVFHALELAQSMVERRRGWESGAAAVRYLVGDAFWAARESGSAWSRDLEEAALAAVPHVTGSPRDYYRRHPAPEPAGLGPQPLAGREEAVLVEYRDGLRLSILLFTGYMLRRAVAIGVAGSGAPIVTSTPTGSKLPDEPMVGPMVPEPDQPKPPTWNFDHLTFFVDRFMHHRRPPFPIERTLLTSGVVDAAFESRIRGARIETPHLQISYAPAGATPAWRSS